MHVVMSLYWCNFLIFGSIKTKLSLNSLEGSNEPLYFLDYDKKFSNISRNFIEPTSFAFVRSSWGRHTIESWAIFQGVPLQAAQNIAKHPLASSFINLQRTGHVYIYKYLFPSNKHKLTCHFVQFLFLGFGIRLYIQRFRSVCRETKFLSPGAHILLDILS